MTEVKNCANCANWKIKPEQLTRDGFARCKLEGHYGIKPASHTCGSHKPATPPR